MARKIFPHKLIPFEPLKEEKDQNGKRVYKVPTGERYRSVTTVLGDSLDKSGLIQWRKMVGEKEANQITAQAASRGTNVHKICESYLLNEQKVPKGTMPNALEMFIQIRQTLDDNIKSIMAIEAPLYSSKLRTAGRCDAIVEWNGVPSILDFKTSRNPKKEEWILSYFLQTTCYSLMLEEMKGIVCPQICVVIATDEGTPQIFIKQRDSYESQVRDIFTNQPPIQ